MAHAGINEFIDRIAHMYREETDVFHQITLLEVLLHYEKNGAEHREIQMPEIVPEGYDPGSESGILCRVLRQQGKINTASPGTATRYTLQKFHQAKQ